MKIEQWILKNVPVRFRTIEIDGCNIKLKLKYNLDGWEKFTVPFVHKTPWKDFKEDGLIEFFEKYPDRELTEEYDLCILADYLQEIAYGLENTNALEDILLRFAYCDWSYNVRKRNSYEPYDEGVVCFPIKGH